MAKDTRELYLDKHVKTKDGQPLKRWISPIGFANLSVKDKARLIKSTDSKTNIPNEFKNKGNKPQNRKATGNVRKSSEETSQVGEDNNTDSGSENA